ETLERCGVADDDAFALILGVAFVEHTPRDEPHSHRAEIVGAYGAVPRNGPLVWLRRGAAFDYEIGVGVVASERKRRNRRRRLHAGQRPDAFQKLAVKRSDLSTFRIDRLGQGPDGGQYVAWVEARITSLKSDEASDQQPRAYEQRQRQRGLGHNQRAENAAAATRAMQTFAAVAERLIEVGLEKLPDRRR